MDTLDLESVLKAVKSLVDYHLPQIPFSPEMLTASGLAISLGLLLVFSGFTVSRLLVAAVGFTAGGVMGSVIAQRFALSQPLAVALGGLIIGYLFFRSFRLWLTLGTATVALMAMAAIQTDGAALNELIAPRLGDGEVITLPTPEEQARNLQGDLRTQLDAIWERASARLSNMTFREAFLPGAAAIVGLIVGWRAARGLAAVWLGLIGAVLAFSGGASLVCAQWPNARPELSNHPQYVLGGIAALWLLGLLSQARHVRWMKRPAAPAAPTK